MDGQKAADVTETGSSTVQQPGEIIRPVVGEGCVEEIAQRRYGLTVRKVKELNSYDDRNYYIEVEPEHSSPTIKQLHEPGYVLKIYNSKDSMTPESFDGQHAIMACLNRNNIPAQKAVPNVDGKYHSIEVVYPDKEKNGPPAKCLVELRTFIPGRIIQEVPYTMDLLFQDGQLIANMTQAFNHIGTDYYKNKDPSMRLWSLTSVPKLGQYTFCLEDERRSLIEDIVSDFNTRVVAKWNSLPKGLVHGDANEQRTGLVHGDANEQNILVSQNQSGDSYRISGILDFADAEYSYPVIDLAMNIAYMMIDSEVVDQLDTPGYILAGYLSVRTLTQEEWDVLVPCVAGRLAQSLTLGAHAQYLEPENTYVLTTAKKGWPLLKKFWAEKESDLLMNWKTIVSNFQYT